MAYPMSPANYSRGKTEFVNLEGMFKWTRHTTPEIDLNGDKVWRTTFYPKPESMEKINALKAEGLKNTIRKDDDGYHLRFGRPVVKKSRAGKVMTFDAPEVVDMNNQPITELLGNGTTGILVLEVYAHGTPGGGSAKAARFAGIKVDNLVPFNAQVDYEKDSPQERMVRGMPDAPSQTW